MEKPMCALLVPQDHESRKQILYGERTAIVKLGQYDYQEGEVVMLCCHHIPFATLANIVRVKHCSISQLTKADLSDAGYENAENLLEQLKKRHPEANSGSPVTLVRWENARGFLVTNKIEYFFNPDGLYGSIDHGK